MHGSLLCNYHQLPDVGSYFSRVSSLFVPLRSELNLITIAGSTFTVSFMLFHGSTMEFE